MKGDVIVVGDDLRRAGAVIADRILPAITARPGRYAIAVAGESGSGKSAAAQSLAEALDERGVRTTIFQQDDYFIYPPQDQRYPAATGHRVGRSAGGTA